MHIPRRGSPLLLLSVFLHISRSDAERQIMQEESGALQLLIAAYIENAFLNIQRQLPHESKLTSDQQELIQDELRGLIGHVKEHPALHTHHHLHVGHTPPQLPQSQLTSVDKRNVEFDFAKPVCPSVIEWKDLSTAYDIDDNEVEVFQPPESRKSSVPSQWFYTVSCTSESRSSRRICPNCCIAIDHTRYRSSCRTKRTLVFAYTKKRHEPEFSWNYIQVNSSCNCAVSSRIESALPDF